MNVYMIQEDSESNCYKAETPMEAIEAAVERFMASLTDQEALTFVADHGEPPREWFLRTCFESCALLGELVNP